VSSTSSRTSSRDPDVRDRIFSSALRRFSEKGYAATSLREISEDARTTKPMIYYYFGSKDGLYSSIIREILDEMASAIVRDFPGGAAPAEQALAFCRRYLDHFLQNEEIIALVLRQVFGLGGVPMATFGEALVDEVRQPLDAIIHRGMEDHVFEECDVNQCATAITGILNMFILAHVFGGAEIDHEAPIRQVAYYIAGLGR
jgi:AcrR family transcriptional regulator